MSPVSIAGASPPQAPTGEIAVQPPPDKVPPAGLGNVVAMVVPMFGSMGVMVFMAFTGTDTRMMLMGGGMVVAMLGMVGINVGRAITQHRNQVESTRRGYLGHLAQVRDEVREAAAAQRRYLNWHLPDPRSLVLIAAQGERLWERPADSPELLGVRLGASRQPLAVRLNQPTLGAQTQPDAVCHSAVNRLVAAHGTLDNLPFGTQLDHLSHIEIGGPTGAGRDQARALLTHLATFAGPESVRIAVLCAEQNRPEWEWVKWLPHARSTEVADAVGPARMVVSELSELGELLGDDVLRRPSFSPRGTGTPWPHLVLLVDGAQVPANSRLGSPEGTAGVTVVELREAWGALTSLTTLRLTLGTGRDGAQVEARMLDVDPTVAVPDALSAAQAEAVARRMAPYGEGERPTADSGTRPAAKRSSDLMELLGLGDIRDFDPASQWTRREGAARLNVPIGLSPEGQPVHLDIKESAQQGMGPHGLLVGATGSGKSEVLRTLVMALAVTHSPDQLNFVLVDFKGGATFAGLANMPHVSAMISNLESELSLVDRMADALRGEMVRRQELLRAAGNYANVTDYEADRLAGKHNHPVMPALFIILDEFSELLSAKPEFIDTFVAIGRLGRSMSIHLLLSSQRLEEGRLRGLESHLSYRVGLRTFSAQESRAVLGVPDAYELPSLPGVGYLSAGSGGLVRFRASYVAAPPPPRGGPAAQPARTARPSAPARALPFTSAPQWEIVREPEPEPDLPTVAPVTLAGDEQWADMTQLDIAVARMAGHGPAAHQVWLPPLDVSDTFDGLFGDLAPDPELGLVSHRGRAAGRLRVPLGTVDLPLEQRRETLLFDLAGAGGHFAVVGGPLTGKSTTLRSMVTALSLLNTPHEVQVYVLDFGGGTFAAYEAAAHVAGVATRDEGDSVRRMVSEIEGIIADRERYFRTHRIDSVQTYRDGRAPGRLDDGYGDVFMVVDGWATIREDFEDLAPRMQQIATRGLTFGVHLLIGASRWMDIRQQVKDLIGSRLELRLGDPGDSEVDRKVAALVPQRRPGRGLDVRRHHVLVALPRIDQDPSPQTLGAGVTDMVERVAAAWPGRPGPKLRLLPARITLDEVHRLRPDSPDILLGVEESRLGPLTFQPRSEAHLFLLGDAKSGKTTFLRSVAREVMRTATPQQAQVFVIDLRRSLLGEVPDDYLNAYLTTREGATAAMGELATILRRRLPGDDVTTEQLRNRSWWTGPDVWVLVDDYDLVATSQGNPVAALQPLMAQALDIGLHIIIARRAGGAARAMFESVLQTMTETGTTGILLSGNPDDGAVIGRVKPRRSPPGRAQVISRDAGLMMGQLAWSDPIA